MKKFIIKFILILLPWALILGYIEHRLGLMNTHYFTKKNALENQLRDIEVLVLGSSNAYYGVNPSYFQNKGYNLALNAQSMYYDEALAEKYISRMPKLKMVILPAIFYTMGTDLEKTSELWRTHFYEQYYDIPLASEKNKTNLKYFLQPIHFSKIALYGPNTYKYYSDSFKDIIDYEPEANGWYDSSSIPPPETKINNGKIAAEAHNLTDTGLYDKNLHYWETLIIQLKAKNIQPVIIQLPSDKSYYENLDQTKFLLMKQKILSLSQKYKFTYVDYTKDPRFTLADFTVMVDHLNPQGAAKFSQIINEDIVVPIMQDGQKNKINHLN